MPELLPTFTPRVPLTERVGAGILTAIALVGALALWGGRALVEALRPPYDVGEIVRHLYEIGWRSTPLLATSGFAIGVVLSMHTRASLERFGAEAMIPAGLAVAVVRETGPLTAALLAAGRVGAGIGAELAAMRVTEQIDALEASAVDAFKFLAVTRIIACMIAMPILTTVMNVSAVGGGFIAEHAISDMSWALYLERAFSLIGFSDLLPSTLKTIVFGFIIGVTGSYLGFAANSGTEGVGQASTRSVVLSSVLIILSNVILVRLIFFFYPQGGA
jgi:phospholipid/cholesterol/gamma-HCH transport system permease protein